MVRLTFLEKKFVSQYLDFFAYSIFKNREILSDQGLSTRNKLIFEFSLVSPMLKMYIDAIAFSMKECLLLFHDIIHRRVWSTFFPKYTIFFFQNISLS